MDLPLCKICGERHRLGHCPEWDEPPPFPNKTKFLRDWIDAPKTPGAPQAVEHHQAQEAEKEATEEVDEAEKQGRRQEAARKQQPVHAPQAQEQERPAIRPASPSKPKFDKTAYQRELMRKRRAAARASHETLSDLQATADPAAPS